MIHKFSFGCLLPAISVLFILGTAVGAPSESDTNKPFCRFMEHLNSATCFNLKLQSGKPLEILRNAANIIGPNLGRLTLNKATGSIDNVTFEGLPKLTGLWIKQSRIDKFADGSLKGLPHLVLLVLKYNKKFPDLTARLFENSSSHLSWISVIANSNMTINSNSLHHLNNATWLHFQHQHLEILTEDFLSTTKNLHELTIMHCNLREIRPNAFDSVPDLEILSLNFNKLQSFAPGTFRNLRNLKILEMHHNPIKNLEISQFKDLVGLEVAGFPSDLLKAWNVEDLLKTFPKLRKMEIKRRDLLRNDTKIFVRQLRRNEIQVIGTPHDCHLPHPPYYLCDSHHARPLQVV